MIVYVNFASQLSSSWEKAATNASSTCWKVSWYSLIWLLSALVLGVTGFCFYIMSQVFTDSPSGASGAQDTDNISIDLDIDLNNCSINRWFIVASGLACIFLLLISLCKNLRRQRKIY